MKTISQTRALCRAVALSATLVTLTFHALATPPAKAKPKPAKPPATGEVSKGTEQMKGGDGVFGVIYTMRHGENLQIISAKYTLEAPNDYNGTTAKPDQKIFKVVFAVKSPRSDSDLDLGGVDMTLVDEDANNYELGSGTTKLAKKGSEGVYLSLKPGQGIGQDPLTNELSANWVVPGNAKIVKILVNDGRAIMPSEKIMRYNLAGYPGGSPKNIVAQLPKYAADPTDPTGATALAVSPAVIGKYYPSNSYALRADAVTTSTTELLKGNPPADGKEWLILTLTAKNAYATKTVSTFYLGNEKTPVLKDADGEKYSPAEAGQRKATRDEDANSKEIEPGEETSFRYFFEVPKGTKFKTVTFGGGTYGHVYQLDLTAVQ